MLVEEDKVSVEVPNLIEEVKEVAEVLEASKQTCTDSVFPAVEKVAEPFVTFASLRQAAEEAARLAMIPPAGFTTMLSNLIQRNWDKDSHISLLTMSELPRNFRLDWLTDVDVAKTLTDAGWEWRYNEQSRTITFGAVGTIRGVRTPKPRTVTKKTSIDKPSWPKPQRTVKPMLKKGKK